MAPEIIGDAGYSAKVDIWSFGGLLMDMLSIHKPWDEFNMDMQIFRQLSKKIAPTVPTDISEDAQYIIKECFVMYFYTF